MRPWRDQYDEVFESEYYQTCCDQELCPCYIIFNTNIRKRMSAILIEHDIRNQRLLNDVCEDAIRRYHDMNEWLE